MFGSTGKAVGTSADPRHIVLATSRSKKEGAEPANAAVALSIVLMEHSCACRLTLLQ